jgi:hypothetical protein
MRLFGSENQYGECACVKGCGLMYCCGVIVGCKGWMYENMDVKVG